MDEQSMKFNIRYNRIRRGLTQEEVAQRLGIARGTYTNLESGSVRILNENLYLLSDILNVTMEELLLGFEPDRDAAARLNDTISGYDVKYRQMMDEFDRKLEEKDTELGTLRDLAETQKKTIATQDEIIRMLRKRIPEENA